MHIVEVIPITKGVYKETLSYFTSLSVTPGMVVTIPLRNKNVLGVVVSVKEAKEAKTEIRKAGFQTKKITAKKVHSLFLEAFIKAAKQTATYTANTTGSVLHAVIPNVVLTEADVFAIPVAQEVPRKSAAVNECLILQEELSERKSRYRSIIRESFARKESVYLCVSTIAEVEMYKNELTKGIELYTFIFHSGVTKTKIKETWKKALSNDHPILIIGTPGFTCVPRTDIQTIIVEREHARSYKQQRRPYLDTRIFLEYLARNLNVRLILADLPLRIETLWRYRENELQDLVPPKMRLLTHRNESIVDMREEEKVTIGKKKFKLISSRLRSTIQHALDDNQHVFLFVPRRGHSPLTVCGDCGSVVRSKDGSTPMTLHKTPEGNVFVSHYTGETRSAAERCSVCGGWKLEALGIGIQRAHEEVAKLFPDRALFVIDQDSTTTHKQALAQAIKFYEKPGGILIGTEMSLRYIDVPVEHSAIVSIDSLLSLPHWKITEQVFSLLLAIREKTTHSYLIQTRKTDHAILEHGRTGNIIDFYKNEIRQRKALFYPPFSVLIKLTCTSTPARVVSEMKEIEKRFEEYGIVIYPAAIVAGRGRHTIHGLLRIDRNNWPSDELLKQLRSLPPSVALNIDPDTLL